MISLTTKDKKERKKERRKEKRKKEERKKEKRKKERKRNTVFSVFSAPGALRIKKGQYYFYPVIRAPF